MRRRAFLSAAAGAAMGCGRKKAIGFRGFAFVANQEGQAVAVVDLTALALTRHIPLGANPAQVLAHPSIPSVYALTPGDASIHEIRAGELKPGRKAVLPFEPSLMKLSPAGDAIWAMCPKGKALIRVPVDTLRPGVRISLPAEPSAFDFAPEDRSTRGAIAISLGAEGALALARGGKVETHALGGETGDVLFRSDGRQAIVAGLSDRQLIFHDIESGRVAVRLPLAVRPSKLCMKPDGGQLFVTGEGSDAVVNVFPFWTEVGLFMLAGRAPGAMAVSRSPEYLFVANPRSGNVSIVNIGSGQSQKMVAQANVGRGPCFIAVTPNDEYACVLNRDSGDMAVLHIPSITAKRSKSATLLTMIPVGSAPVSAVVKAAG